MSGLLVSLILVLVSSYFVTSVYTPKQGKHRCSAFLILLCTMFAQIVLSFEILSLFKAINSTNVLIMNVIFFTASLIFWLKKGRPVYVPDLKTAFRKIWNGLKRDKFLLVMTFGMCFFMLVSVILCVLAPIKGGDALSYHLNRSSFWLFQGSLNHFVTTDVRNLIMPINSEILYLWVLSFLKDDVGLGLFSFIGYFAGVYSVYNILGYFNFSERRKLWSIVCLSSLAIVVIEASSSDTDVMTAGMVLSSIYLFLSALKEKSMSLLFFSSLIYALAVGTKTPVIIAFPGVFLFLAFWAYHQHKKEFVKIMSAFLGMLFLNFLVFSSYNYILNFIDYHDFLSTESFRIYNHFIGGAKAVIANFIRYLFWLVDFTGFRCSDGLAGLILSIKTGVFSFLNIPYDLGVITADTNETSRYMRVETAGIGLLGFLLYLPALLGLIIAFVKKLFFKTKFSKIDALFAFAVLFFINILCLSFSIGHTIYGIRYFSTMVIISSPILALTYFKKNYVVKTIVLFVVMSYFLVLSLNISELRFKDVIGVYLSEKNVHTARERIRCTDKISNGNINEYCHLRNIMQILPDGKNIGMITESAPLMYIIKMTQQYGIKTDIIMAEDIESYDLKKYDYIIKTNENYSSYNILQEKQTQEPDEKYLSRRKQELKGSSCYYLDFYTMEHLSANLAENNVYMVKCNITDDYLKYRGFDLFQKYNFVSDKADNNVVMTIYNKIQGE